MSHTVEMYSPLYKSSIKFFSIFNEKDIAISLLIVTVQTNQCAALMRTCFSIFITKMFFTSKVSGLFRYNSILSFDVRLI